MARPRALPAVALLVALLLGACGGGSSSTPPEASPPPTTAGRPEGPGPAGEVVDRGPTGTVAGATTTRFTYRSTDVHGDPALVTGMVVVPDGATAGDPVIAWAHPTTGTGDACAPSTVGAATVAAVEDLVAAGFVIVATDYEGLGAAGPHPYLVSDSEARALLDALTAAASMPDAAVDPGAPVLLWGFSQGGHAALAAAERLGALAPDLDVRGVAVAAPVSDVTAFLARSLRPEQLGVALAIVHGARLADPSLDPAAILTDRGTALLDRLDDLCMGELVATADQPVDDLLRTDPSTLQPWRAVLDAQRPGDDGVGLPVLILHGEDDEIIPTADSLALQERLCRAGDPVHLVLRAGDDHAVRADPDLVSWLGGRLAGVPPPSDCP